MTTNLEIIRAACIKANPEIVESTYMDKPYTRPIRLADVLLAIEASGKYPSAMDKYSAFGTVAYYHWYLKDDDLAQQSEETLAFIAELLK